MTTTNRTLPATAVALLSIIALLLALVAGSGTSLAQTDEPTDEPTPECTEPSEDGDEDDASAASTDCDDDDDDGEEEKGKKGNDFKDVDGKFTHAEAIQWLSETGITSGCAPNKFCPNKPLTRGQFATFLYTYTELFGLGDTGGPTTEPEPTPSPTPEPDTSTSALEAEVEALQQQVDELTAQIERLQP